MGLVSPRRKHRPVGQQVFGVLLEGERRRLDPARVDALVAQLAHHDGGAAARVEHGLELVQLEETLQEPAGVAHVGARAQLVVLVVHRLVRRPA